MQIFEELGLPVETINQAATFFVNKVGYKKADLLPLHKGKSATVYRPSLNLYWRLKLGRLSENDVLDCQHYFHFCKGQKDRIDLAHLKETLTASKKLAKTQEKLINLQSLQQLVESN